MRHSNILLVLMAASYGAGCVRFEPKPLSAPQTAAQFEGRTLADPGLRTYLETNLKTSFSSWPPPTWDGTQLTWAAFYYSPDLDVARARWAVAQAGTGTAGERPNPTLGVTPAYNTTTHIPSPWLVTPTLDLPLEVAGKRGYRLDQARHLSEAARLHLTAAAWQVRSRVRRSLMDLHAARESTRLLEQQQNLQTEMVRLLEGQHSAGAISAFELTQARLASDSARLALHDARRQETEARGQLADAIGLPAIALDSARIAWSEFDQLPAAVPAPEARRQALFQRADVLGALEEYAASQAALQLEIAKQYPDIHLNPGYEFDQGDNKWSLGLTVTLPVLSQNQGPIGEAEAKRTEAAAAFTALQGRVLGEVDRAVTGYRLARAKQADAALLQANLQKQEKAAQAMREAGEISSAELAAVRLQLSVSALTGLDAFAKAQQALVQLEDTLQSPVGWPASAWERNPRVSSAAEATPRP